MLYEPGERTKNLPRIESLIRNSVEGQDFFLVAETDNKLIGYISAQKGRLNRIAHWVRQIPVCRMKNSCG